MSWSSTIRDEVTTGLAAFFVAALVPVIVACTGESSAIPSLVTGVSLGSTLQEVREHRDVQQFHGGVLIGAGGYFERLSEDPLFSDAAYVMVDERVALVRVSGPDREELLDASVEDLTVWLAAVIAEAFDRHGDPTDVVVVQQDYGVDIFERIEARWNLDEAGWLIVDLPSLQSPPPMMGGGADLSTDQASEMLLGTRYQVSLVADLESPAMQLIRPPGRQVVADAPEAARLTIEKLRSVPREEIERFAR
ncbi:MAG: hypothetical protein AAF430_01315 [Myxococcota bacterium]